MDFGYYSPNSMSSAQLRRIRKPIIERKRRERINRCLEQIKSLVLKALNQDETKYEKMDKADILEMAVRHLLDQQRTRVNATYKAGYRKCASEVNSYLQKTTSSTLTEGMEARLINHLTHNPHDNRLASGHNTKLLPALSVNIPQVACKLEEGMADQIVRCSSAPETRLSPGENQHLLAIPKPLSPPTTPSHSSTLFITPPPTPFTASKRNTLRRSSAGESSAFRSVHEVKTTGDEKDDDSDMENGSERRGMSSPVWRPW